MLWSFSGKLRLHRSKKIFISVSRGRLRLVVRLCSDLLVYGHEAVQLWLVHPDSLLFQHQPHQVQREAQVPVQRPRHRSWNTATAEVRLDQTQSPLTSAGRGAAPGAHRGRRHLWSLSWPACGGSAGCPAAEMTGSDPRSHQSPAWSEREACWWQLPVTSSQQDQDQRQDQNTHPVLFPVQLWVDVSLQEVNRCFYWIRTRSGFWKKHSNFFCL